jgi:hypothetical protein
MKVYIFFACLCFLLIRGDQYVLAGTSHSSISYFPAKVIESGQQLNSADISQNYTDLDDDRADEEDDYLISDEVEDEDGNDFLARKYRLLARFYLALSYVFLLVYLYKCYKSPPRFWGYLSYIYIKQGVLRI